MRSLVPTSRSFEQYRFDHPYAAWIAWTLLTLVSWEVWAILLRLIGDRILPRLPQAISRLGSAPVTSSGAETDSLI